MKRTMLSTLVLAIVLAVFLFGLKSVSTANAAITGVPVICNRHVLEGSALDLICTLPDGSTFTIVPASNYFFVTDVYVRGSASGAWTSQVQVDKLDSFWAAIDYLNFAGAQREKGSEHFTTPGMLVLAGQKMSASNGASAGAIYVKVTGILTTNSSYLPLIQK